MPFAANLTRRRAMLGALKGTLATSLAPPLALEATEPSPVPATDFVPENDYPFFGPDPSKTEQP